MINFSFFFWTGDSLFGQTGNNFLFKLFNFLVQFLFGKLIKFPENALALV